VREIANQVLTLERKLKNSDKGARGVQELRGVLYCEKRGREKGQQKVSFRDPRSSDNDPK